MENSSTFSDEPDSPAHGVAWLLCGCARGTLWRVREDVWGHYSTVAYRNSTRKWHLGLCFSVLDDPHRPVASMLHGTTGTSGPLVLRGLTEEGGPDYPTSFGHLLACVPSHEFTGSAPDRDPSKLTGPWFRARRVSVNWHKTSLTQEELQEMDKTLPKWMHE